MATNPLINHSLETPLLADNRPRLAMAALEFVDPRASCEAVSQPLDDSERMDLGNTLPMLYEYVVENNGRGDDASRLLGFSACIKASRLVSSHPLVPSLASTLSIPSNHAT